MAIPKTGLIGPSSKQLGRQNSLLFKERTLFEASSRKAWLEHKLFIAQICVVMGANMAVCVCVRVQAETLHDWRYSGASPVKLVPNREPQGIQANCQLALSRCAAFAVKRLESPQDSSG